MIELQDVTKRFGDFTALNELRLHIPTGGVYGLIGPNGAGKTTAIRHITGMLRPDRGSVTLDGESVWENVGAKERMFCIPDEPWAFAGASTAEMARFYGDIYPHFDRKRFDALREFFALDEKRPIRRLSRGMKKQSAFWLALSLRPEVLLLDEPVDGLDPLMRRQVWSLLLSDVAEYGTTVLVSSHNLRELEDVCDRVGILRQGRCILEKSVAELQETTVKFVLSLPEGTALPEGLSVLGQSTTGRLTTLILRGREEELTQRLQTLHPAFLDPQPMTLEEIFIYELGGADRGFREVL